jgi:hypothetical protein
MSETYVSLPSFKELFAAMIRSRVLSIAKEALFAVAGDPECEDMSEADPFVDEISALAGVYGGEGEEDRIITRRFVNLSRVRRALCFYIAKQVLRDPKQSDSAIQHKAELWISEITHGEFLKASGNTEWW